MLYRSKGRAEKVQKGPVLQHLVLQRHRLGNIVSFFLGKQYDVHSCVNYLLLAHNQEVESKAVNPEYRENESGCKICDTKHTFALPLKIWSSIVRNVSIILL